MTFLVRMRIIVVVACTTIRFCRAFTTTFGYPLYHYVPSRILESSSSSSSRRMNVPGATDLGADENDTSRSGGTPSHTRAGSTSTAQDLLQKAQQLRAEIASLEGKSLQQVQMEAQDKKQRETLARREWAQQREQNEIIYQQTTIERFGRALTVPTTQSEMIVQAARAIERAVADGKMRQTIRLALVTSSSTSTSSQRRLQSEQQSILDSGYNMWPGGVVQMSREAARPATRALFQELQLGREDENTTTTTTTRNQMKKNIVVEEEIWDFDGSCMVRLLSPSGGNKDENRILAQALVFANTDVKYTKDIQALLLSSTNSPYDDQKKNDITIQQKQQQQPLTLLVNPFWRNIDSWGINILAPGARRLAQTVIFDSGLAEETYACIRFQCRGEECISIKAYPYDWQIFAYLEEEPYYGGGINVIRLGESKEEPKSDYVTALLNQRPEFKLSKTMRQMKR